jgi:hypothetical protein
MSQNYLGDFNVDATVEVFFDSVNASGASTTITGLALADIKVYKDGSTTERASTSGYTLLDTDGIDFDTITGIHGFSLDLSDNTTAGFWAAGSNYVVVVDSVTLESQTVSFIAAEFSIENRYQGPTAAAIADAVWDEAISGHQTASTFGRYGTMAGPILVDTTIAAGTPSTTTFELTAGSTIDDFYNDMFVYLVSGTGTGQARPVKDYIGSTKQIIVDEPWVTTPAVADQVIILAAHAHPLSQISGAILGVAGAALSNIEFLMVDSTTKDPSTGLTVTGQKSIDG